MDGIKYIFRTNRMKTSKFDRKRKRSGRSSFFDK